MFVSLFIIWVMFAKEYDTEEQKMSMKVLWLGREKKGKKKTYSRVLKNAAIGL